MATRMNDSDEQVGMRLDCRTIQPFRLILVILTALLNNGKGGKGLSIRTFVAKTAKTTCKKSLLLHSAGLEVQDLYYSLVDEKTDKHSFEEAMQLLIDNLMPQRIIPFKRHFFRQVEQAQQGTVTEFVCRLCHIANNCNFGAAIDEHIRDHIIEKCNSRELRAKFLEKADLKLLDVLSIARAHEAVRERLEAMDCPMEPNFAAIMK